MQNPYLQQKNQLSLDSLGNKAYQSSKYVSYETKNQKDGDQYSIQTQSKPKDDLSNYEAQQYKGFQQSYDIENHFLEKYEFSQRKKFSTQIFFLLTIQQLITCIMVTVEYFSQSFSDLLMNPSTQFPTALFWCMLVITFFTEIIVFLSKDSVQEIPINYIFLVIFTLSFSFVISGASAICKSIFENFGELIFIITFMALTAYGSLNLYSYISQQELNWKIATLCVFISQLLMFLIFSITFQKYILLILICAFIVSFYGMLIFVIQEEFHKSNIYDFVIGVVFIYIKMNNVIIRIPQCMLEVCLKH